MLMSSPLISAWAALLVMVTSRCCLGVDVTEKFAAASSPRSSDSRSPNLGITGLYIFPRRNSQKVRDFFRDTGGLFLYNQDNFEEVEIQLPSREHESGRKIIEIERPIEVVGIPQMQESESVGKRTNRTCMVRKPYTCKKTLRTAYQGYCRVGFYITRPCTRFRNQLVDDTCYAMVKECCENYELGASGFCEIKGSSSVCGPRLITNSSGILTLPGYPQEYGENLDCSWVFRGPLKTRVIMQYVDVKIEDAFGVCNYGEGHCYDNCQFDWVRISGVSGASKPRTLCGSIVPVTWFLSASNEATVSFHSDDSNGGRGFKLVFNIVAEDDIVPRRSCTRGRVWRLCHRECAMTCDSLAPRHFGTWNICTKSDGTNHLVDASRMSDVTCLPGCVCPDDRPIWHQNQCIKMEDCQRSRFKCGIPLDQPSPKIIGGKTARDGAWPWMVQITTNNQYSDCGATLVCSDWVITAAHCFLDKETWSMPEKVDRRLYWFHLGKYWKHEQEDGRRSEAYRAKRVILHPNYDFDTDTNDIALVQLDGYVKNIDSIRPICLPDFLDMNVKTERQMNATEFRPSFNDTCIVAGWGTTRNVGPTSAKLKEMRMPMKPDKQCSSYKSYVWRKMICAGGVVDNDTCKGDSGGPFMCRRNRRWFLDGVTSFGDDCGTAKPGGYTRVSNYIPWIRRYVGLNCGKPT